MKPSLILLNYNNYQFLQECLMSVQPHQDKYKEIVLLDDKSHDAAIDDIEELVVKYLPGATVVQNEINLGVKQSLFQLLHANTFEWVQILATDDVLLEIGDIVIGPENSKYDLILSDGLYIDISGQALREYKNYRSTMYLPFINLQSFLFYHNPVIAPGVIFHSHNALEGLENSNVNFEDWPIVRNTLMMNGKFINLIDAKIGYRRHNNSLSSATSKHRQMLDKQIIIFLEESLQKTNSHAAKLFIHLQLNSIATGSKLLKSLKLFDFGFIYWKIRKMLFY